MLLPHLKRLEIELGTFLEKDVVTSSQIPGVEELHIWGITEDITIGSSHSLVNWHIKRLKLSGDSARVLRLLSCLNNLYKPRALALTVSSSRTRKSAFEDAFPDNLLCNVESLEISFDSRACRDQELALHLTNIICRMARDSSCLLKIHQSPSNHIFLPVKPVSCRLSIECEETAFQGQAGFSQLPPHWPTFEQVQMAVQHTHQHIALQLLSHSRTFTFTTSSEFEECVGPTNWPPSITSIDLNNSCFRFDDSTHGLSPGRNSRNSLGRTIFHSLAKIRCTVSAVVTLMARQALPVIEDITIVAETDADILSFYSDY